MTVHCYSQSWAASGYPAAQDVGDRERARITSLPTKGTAIRTVGAGCGSDRSSTPFPSDATSARNEPVVQGGRFSSTKPFTPVVMSSSAASIG